ncbi:MAG: hypothetical protein NXI21_00695 [Alphaproteobacteria bacterium]|nr:hypothetical protein [Alphaproteobacteria bacterium]
MRSIGRRVAVAALLVLTVTSSGCVTATPEGPPPMTVRPGPAPTAALLPWYTKDYATARFAYDQLVECLAARNVFRFVPRERALQAVAGAGYEMERVFGLEDAEYVDLAERLEADFVMHGAFTILRDLTVFGWRGDVTADLRLVDAAAGERVGYWRETTAATFALPDSFTDEERMAASAMNHLCARIIEATAARAPSG